MSSRSQANCETTSLFPDSSRSASRSRGELKFSPETLLIPVALGAALGTLLPSTTGVEIVRQIICKLSNTSRYGDPPNLLTSHLSSSDVCDTPEIARSFSTVLAIFGVMEGIISVVECGLLSYFSSSYGRKPALLFVFAAGVAGKCLIPGSQFTPDGLPVWVYLVGMLCQMFSGLPSYMYLINMYVVDVSAPEHRTAALSRIAGWAALGTCIPLALGGSITTSTGDPLTVFYISAAILVSALIYIVSVLPESFPEEKRNALCHMRPGSSAYGTATLMAPFLRVFGPLLILVPTRTTGRARNWRLALCAMHNCVFTTASAYTMAAWLVLATSKYHFTPADTGFFLTIVTVSTTVALAVLFPSLVRFLRPYYSRKTIPSPLAGEDSASIEETELETSDHLDVHMAFLSCLLVGVMTLGVAASTTVSALIISGIFLGLSSIRAPMIHSLTAGSVDPLKQGEALAAVDMVGSIGTVLSPLIMGSLLTATINTAPLLIFYVHLVVVLISAVPLFFVRDADRYQKPSEM